MPTFSSDVFVGLGMAVILGGCTATPRLPPPKSVSAFCGTKTVDVAALRRVAAAVIDGDHFKSSASSFQTKVKPRFDEFGGAVGFWEPHAFDLPKSKTLFAPAHLVIRGVAIPDNGNRRYPFRLVYLGLSGRQSTPMLWDTAASNDLENICT